MRLSPAKTEAVNNRNFKADFLNRMWPIAVRPLSGQQDDRADADVRQLVGGYRSICEVAKFCFRNRRQQRLPRFRQIFERLEPFLVRREEQAARTRPQKKQEQAPLCFLCNDTTAARRRLDVPRMCAAGAGRPLS